MVTHNNDETLTNPLLKRMEGQQQENTGVDRNTSTPPVRSAVLDEDDLQSNGPSL